MNDAIGDGRFAEAEALARDLELLIISGYGEQHDYCAQIREMQAHIAHLAGMHAEATAKYLGVTGIRAHTLGRHHPLTQASAHRAAATWRAIDDPEKKQEFADGLLAMLTDVTGKDSKVTRGARAHLTRLTT